MQKPDPYDFDALLAFHKATFGDATMTAPAGEPGGDPAPPAAPGATITNTAGGGVLVGADPRTTPSPTFTIVGAPNTSSGNPAQVFSAEDIQKARQQEKDKLYPELQTMKEQLAELKKERDEKLAAEEKARKEAEAALKKQQEADTDTRTLLEQQKAEFESKLEALNQERQQERAVLEMERAFQELQAYRESAIAGNVDNIIPQLVDELRAANHTSKEEIDAHIARLVSTSASIMENVQAAVQQQRAGMRGAPVTAPPAGPLDTYSGHDPALEAAANGTLTFDDYVKNRDKLLRGVSKNAGLYG